MQKERNCIENSHKSAPRCTFSASSALNSCMIALFGFMDSAANQKKRTETVMASNNGPRRCWVLREVVKEGGSKDGSGR